MLYINLWCTNKRRENMCITFNEIINYYPNNRNVINQLFESIKNENSNIVPFIGAGLSCINLENGKLYPLWSETLKMLTNVIEFDDNEKTEKERNKILDKINTNPQYAADMIFKAVKKDRFNDEMVNIFTEEKIINVSLKDETVSLLPKLFPKNTLITTNFDRILERVYENTQNKFDEVLTPIRTEKIKQCEDKDIRFLFKIHGDISKKAIEDIVFTRQQYKDAYHKNRFLQSILANWFSQKTMLFLGCSLNQDKPLDILKLTKNRRKHYAILPCCKEEMYCRAKFLKDNYNIEVIFYPNGKFDSPRIILENLLVLTKVDLINRGQAEITFGQYPQSAEKEDWQPIEWKVIYKNNKKALLLSKYVLDRKMYNDESLKITWQKSSLRRWLNSFDEYSNNSSGFYNLAFNSAEKRQILQNTESTKDDFYHTYYDEHVYDKIILLEKKEVEEYLVLKKDIIAKPTAYAEKRGIRSFNEYCNWWIYSDNSEGKTIYIDSEGQFLETSSWVMGGFIGVRPAIWITLTNEIETPSSIFKENSDSNISAVHISRKDMLSLIENTEDEVKKYQWNSFYNFSDDLQISVLNNLERICYDVNVESYVESLKEMARFLLSLHREKLEEKVQKCLDDVLDRIYVLLQNYAINDVFYLALKEYHDEHMK